MLILPLEPPRFVDIPNNLCACCYEIIVTLVEVFGCLKFGLNQNASCEIVTKGSTKLRHSADLALLLANSGSSCGMALIDPATSAPRVSVLTRSCVTGFNALGPALGFAMTHQQLRQRDLSEIDPRFDNMASFLVNKPVKFRNSERFVQSDNEALSYVNTPLDGCTYPG